MAKGTRYGGYSHTEDELSDPDAPAKVIIKRAELGYVDRKEESSSLGNNGSPSDRSDETPTDNSGSNLPQHAQMMENRSNQRGSETDSDAASTVGSGRKTISRPSARKANTRSTVEDDFDFD